MSEKQQIENKKKLQFRIIAIVSGAILILAVIFLYLYPYFEEELRKEKEIQQLTDDMEQRFDSNVDAKKEIDKTLKESGLAGTYTSGGDIGVDEDNWTYSAIELKEDGTAVAVSAADGIGKTAWWSTEEKNGVQLIVLGVDGKNEPNVYQLYGSHLIDTSSMYSGPVETGKKFDSSFVLGDMHIDINADGTASAEFTDTNEASANKGTTFVYNGEYTVDGEFVNITLNTVTTRFLMYDFEMPGYGNVSGIASLFFTKQ